MSAVDHKKNAEKAEYRRHVGDFDGWVQDEQEKQMRYRYQDYLDECPTDIPAQEWPAAAMSFEEFCADFADKYDPTE